MLQAVEETIAPDFIEYFESYRSANFQNWNGALCVLAPLHWMTLKHDFLRVLKTNQLTENLDDIWKEFEEHVDDSYTLHLHYVNKKTGLQKGLSCNFSVKNGIEYLVFAWTDSVHDDYIVSEIPMRWAIKNAMGTRVEDVFHVGVAWMLDLEAKVGLMPEMDSKLEYLRNIAMTHHNPLKREYIERYSSSIQCMSQIFSPLKFLAEAWPIRDFKLVHIASFIHKLLVNYPSQYHLSPVMTGNLAAKSFVADNGNQNLEAWYKHGGTGADKKLSIVKQGSGVGALISVMFGDQMIEMNAPDFPNSDEVYVNPGNVWKLSARAKVQLFCETNVEKLNQLIMMFYLWNESEIKQDFIRMLLLGFKADQGTNEPWYDQFLKLDDSSDYFREGNFIAILGAEYIGKQGGAKEFELLLKAWRSGKPTATPFLAFFIHGKLIMQTSNMILLNERGPMARSKELRSGALTSLEATYMNSQSGKTSKLIVTVDGKEAAAVSFGGKTTNFLIPDLVRGRLWKGEEDGDNYWHLADLTSIVEKLIVQ